jgi:hypothetical protein
MFLAHGFRLISLWSSKSSVRASVRVPESVAVPWQLAAPSPNLIVIGEELEAGETQFLLSFEVHYRCTNEHRNGAIAQESQWSIPRAAEVTTFVAAAIEGWQLEHQANDAITHRRGWGLHLLGGRPAPLGTARSTRADSFVAKFVDGNATQRWHGYPADHEATTADIPDAQVLERWVAAGLINHAKRRKMMRQHPCRL